jgi:hypothetical protein
MDSASHLLVGKDFSIELEDLPLNFEMPPSKMIIVMQAEGKLE